MDSWLRRACRAINASQGAPFHATSRRKGWPRARRSVGQRRAVWRLPLRSPAPAGVTMNKRAIDTLSSDLVAARDHLARTSAGFEGERLLGPRLAIVNPPLWEIGHIGWFQEHWCLRWEGDRLARPSILPNAANPYDSSNAPPDTPWDRPLPGLPPTPPYLNQVLEGHRHRPPPQPA